MLDFTSAMYLGLPHASWSLRPWGQLSTGRPAALAELPCAQAVAGKLAALQGSECATLGPSTLHLFWDLFGILAAKALAIYMDGGVYPIARWGVERAAARGVPTQSFPHHNANALRGALRIDELRRRCPVVVTDGFCPGCGKAAPLAAYLELARRYGGYLVVDDTQALGILGETPNPDAPYGRGGGGSLRWCEVSGTELLVISSLAKGFGVPVALLAGSKKTVQSFEAHSETRVHCSPPSVAALHAAEHALTLNQQQGDTLRLRLAQLVSCFRNRLALVGFSAIGGLFPVQTLAPARSLDALTLHERMLRLGTRTVLRRAHTDGGPQISFLITARHSPGEIDRAIDALANAARNQRVKTIPSEASHETRMQL
jgi:8-amino-7-oxononanoate synthase